MELVHVFAPVSTLLAWEKLNKNKNLAFNVLHSLFEEL